MNWIDPSLKEQKDFLDCLSHGLTGRGDISMSRYNNKDVVVDSHANLLLLQKEEKFSTQKVFGLC